MRRRGVGTPESMRLSQSRPHNGTIRRTAARLSLALSVLFLALLAVLHVLEPEFNSGHLISEYQLGEYGFLMSLAFCLLGASAALLALYARWTRRLVGVARCRRGFFHRGYVSSNQDARFIMNIGVVQTSSARS